MKNRNRKLANLALLLCAFVWGTAFVAQSVGMDYVGPFTFQCVRSFIGMMALIPVIVILDGIKKRKGIYKKNTIQENKKLLMGGICCGTALCVASCFQQIGIQYTSVGNAGFITSMYMILVPVLSVFFRKKVQRKIWVCVAIAAVGMYFLSISENMSISKGDGLIAICAVCFSIHIMVVDYFASEVDGVKLSCIQFLVSGVITILPMIFIETPKISYITAAIIPLLYTGVLSSGVAYTLQILGQQYAEPTIATLLMSLESVFSLVGGIVVLSQFPTVREFLGCVLVFAAVIASQVSLPKSQMKKT